MSTPPVDPHDQLHISSDETAAAFSDKMHQLELKELERLTQVKALQSSLQYIHLVGIPVPPGPLSLVPESDARRLKLVCFDDAMELKKFAVVDPTEEVKTYVDNLTTTSHSHAELYLMSQASFDAVIKLYAQLPKIKESKGGVEITAEDLAKYGENVADIRTLSEVIKGASLTEIMTILVAAGLKTNASDIHIEAEESAVIARLRIDGVLHEIAKLNSDTWSKIISRVKLLSGLKININDKPQDGRFTIHLAGDSVDVRVSTIPTSFGESVVMRLLRSSSVGLKFEELGLSGYQHKLLKDQIMRPNGMIITTGPTGSGKTTTLYAILNTLNSPEVKIITLEDPVEYKLVGINQSQIDEASGYTFAVGLRSILRQDPDVVMVGEIRDFETADTAINAALTGHLVLSTIHTNSAAGAVPRFIAMEVKSFLLAPALAAIMGQRLVRRLCTVCRQETALEGDMKTKVEQALSSIAPASGIKVDLNTVKFYVSKGCEACYGLGYKGRVGIYEIMTMSPEIADMIQAENVSEHAISEQAVKQGMVTMLQDGLLRALEGTTSVDEVFSVAI